MTAPGWNMNLRRGTLDQGGLLDGGEIVLSRSSYAISKRRAVTIQGVCGSTPVKRGGVKGL